MPEWYRKLKGDQAIDNETYKNLEKGTKYRFVKGDKQAGRYKRSHITIEKLQSLQALRKDVVVDNNVDENLTQTQEVL